MKKFVSPVPASTSISKGYGYVKNPDTNQSILHEGLDFAAPVGSDIVAVKDGKVIATHNEYKWEDLGKFIILEHADSTATLYAQCGEIFVTIGETVTEGQKIAEVGNGINNEESHCHFAINAYGQVDPTNLILND